MIYKGKNNGLVQKPDSEYLVTECVDLLPFLLNRLSKMSRNNAKSLLKHKQVFVDDALCSQHDYSLLVGQTVKIVENIIRNDKRENLLDIVFEDQSIIIINKPAGLLSISTDNGNEYTAYKMVTEYVKMENQNNRIYIVHRLDRDTSGLLLFAKNEKVKYGFQKNWSTIMLNRGYISIIEGQPKEQSGTIKSYLLETKTHLMFSSSTKGDGLEAITNYKMLKTSGRFSLVDIRLLTGRKNQIRVHMKDIGHPIVGDKQYGSRTNLVKRLCLHAHLLEFNHPITNVIMRFETEIPKQFASILSLKSQKNVEVKKC